MHNLVIILKSLVLFLVAMFTELIISWMMLLSFMPTWLKDFFHETKEGLGWLVSFSIFILTVIKIINSNKKKYENSSVKEWQHYLNGKGAKLTEDGIWGPLTEAASLKYMGSNSVTE